MEYGIEFVDGNLSDFTINGEKYTYECSFSKYAHVLLLLGDLCFNSSYGKFSPAVSIDRGVLISATWGSRQEQLVSRFDGIHILGSEPMKFWQGRRKIPSKHESESRA